MESGAGAAKEPVVIELTTNLRTGLTSVVGASSVPCPECKSRRTRFEKETKEIVCEEDQCGKKTKLT